jgi:hypothetical protein
MAFKPALTHEQLVEIQERNKGSADVFALLWEIKRLRAVVLQADQLQRSVEIGGGPGMVLRALRETLKDEPCVQEFPKLDMGKK